MMKRISQRFLVAILTLTGLVTLTPLAHAASTVFAMPLVYSEAGLTQSAGTMSARIYFNGPVNSPSASGSVASIQPSGDWNAVAYGTQTLVSCQNELSLPDGRKYSLCFVKAKMEVPVNYKASIDGTIHGIRASLGYDSGSGRQYVFFEGTVEVYRFTDSYYSLCVSWSYCHKFYS